MPLPSAVPAIAESYDLSDDGLTYTFHLRDAKWTNGDAVTANVTSIGEITEFIHIFPAEDNTTE